MKKTILAVFVIFAMLACQEGKKPSIPLQNYIPENSGIIVQSPNLSEFLEQTNTVPFLKQNPDFLNLQTQTLNELPEVLKKTNSIFCQILNAEGKTTYLLITRIDSTFRKDSLVAPLIQGKSIIQNVDFGKNKVFSKNDNDILFISNSKSLLQDINGLKNNMQDDYGFSKAWAAADKNKTSIFLNNKAFSKDISGIFSKISVEFKNPLGWNLLEPSQNGKDLVLNGISTSSSWLQIFNEITPQSSQLAAVTPEKSEGFFSFTYKDFRKLYRNLHHFRKDSTQLKQDQFLDYTLEAGIISYKKEPFLAFATIDADLAKGSLSLNRISEYRDINIYMFPENFKISEVFKPIIRIENPKYYCFLDTFMICGSSQETLQQLIAAYDNKQVLQETAYYKQAISQLADASSFLMVSNTSENTNENYNFKDYPIATLQFVQNSSFSHLHLIIGQGKPSEEKEFSQNSSFSLDAEPATNPVLVENHNTHRPEIAVQDVENQLYLFTESGKLLWKKQLKGRVLGEIKQVDLFKNGNLQLIFATQNSVTVIDRTGKTVAPFPLEFQDELTQPLSVFDYNNNRDYRFVITQQNELFMVDGKGKMVKGFHFDKAGSKILEAPKHIRIRNKDYIVFPEENGKLDILSRQGRERINVKQKIDFSSNKWYKNNNYFISVNKKGELVRVDQKGNVQPQKIGDSEKPLLAATEDVKVLLSGNILKINEVEVELHYGLYTNPKLFEVRNKNLISITDIQAHKVYVFDEKGQLLPDFPVYGTSSANISNFDGGNTELCVKGDKNTVLLYYFSSSSI